jgi:hypothetical protein
MCCGAEKQKFSQVMYGYETLASPRHTNLCFILSTQKMLNIPNLGQKGNFVNEKGSNESLSDCMAQSSRLRGFVHRHRKGSKPVIIYSCIYIYKYSSKFCNIKNVRKLRGLGCLLEFYYGPFSWYYSQI